MSVRFNNDTICMNHIGGGYAGLGSSCVVKKNKILIVIII